MAREKNSSAGEVLDPDSYAHKLYLADFLRVQVIRSAIRALQLPSGSRGLDAGCGTGSNTLLLAEAVAPGGHVTGLDLSPELLSYARETAEKSSLSRNISFLQGDVGRIPFDNGTFDWAWSADCVGVIPVRPLPLLGELARVVKTGGSVAILAWSSQQLLPGYPLLEARLNATSAGIAPFASGMSPQQHFLRALGWFGEAGLKELGAQTFVGSVHAPLSDEVRSALLSLFEMRWEEAQSEMTTEDWAEYQRLFLPESPDFILDLPDYCAFFTYSMFCGRVAGRGVGGQGS